MKTMKQALAALMIPALLAIAGCQTTADAQNSISSSYVGTPADDFFARHGAPFSTYQRQDGGRMYSWRGGERTVSVAPPPPPPPLPGFGQPAFGQPAFGQPAFGQPAFGQPFGTAPFGQQATSQTIFADSRSRTSTQEYTRADGTRVTESQTRSSGVNVGLDPSRLAGAALGTQPAARPQGQTRQLLCELSITADANNTITSISVQRDTQGVGASFSRCAEVFGS
jgi:hypothetical protein